MPGFTPPPHSPFPWFDTPSTQTPLDSANLMAAESDLISYAQQVVAAYDTFANGEFALVTAKDQPNGYAGLDSSGLLNIAEMPSGLIPGGVQVIGGEVDTHTPGTIVRGTGYSIVRNGTGDVTVTFTTPFTSVPNVVVGGGEGTIDAFVRLNSQTPVATNHFRVIIQVPNTGVAIDDKFTFVAFGPGPSGQPIGIPGPTGATGATGPQGPAGTGGGGGTVGPHFWQGVQIAAPSEISRFAIAADGLHNAFPWVTAGKDGRLYAVMREASNENNSLGKIALSISSDGGATWSAKQYIAVPANYGNWDLRDPGICCTLTGRLIVSFWEFNSTVNEPTCFVVTATIYSDDNGATWSAPQIHGDGVAFSGSAGAALQHTNGTLILPQYGGVMGDTVYTAFVRRSTDDGTTWGPPIFIGGHNTGYNEMTIVETNNSHTLAFIRIDVLNTFPTIQHIYLATSLDQGQTWTTPQALPWTGVPCRPAAAVSPATDLILLWYRDASEHQMYRYSVDEGVTWSNEIVFDGVHVFNYSGGIAVAENILAFAWSSDISGNRCDTNFITFKVGTLLSA